MDRELLSFPLYCKTVSVFCGYFINHCHLRCLCFIASNTQVGFQHPAMFVRKQIHQRVIYLQKSTSMGGVVSGLNIRIKTEHWVVIFNMLLYFLTFISLYTLFLLTLIKKKVLKKLWGIPLNCATAVHILKKEWPTKNGYLNKEEEEEYACICTTPSILKVYRLKSYIVCIPILIRFIYKYYMRI